MQARIEEANEYFNKVKDVEGFIEAYERYGDILLEIPEPASNDPFKNMLYRKQTMFCEFSMVLCQIRAAGIPINVATEKLRDLNQEFAKLKMPSYCQQIETIFKELEDQTFCKIYSYNHAHFIRDHALSDDILKDFFGIPQPTIGDQIEVLKSGLEEIAGETEHTQTLQLRAELHEKLADVYSLPPVDEEDLTEADNHYRQAIEARKASGSTNLNDLHFSRIYMHDQLFDLTNDAEHRRFIQAYLRKNKLTTHDQAKGYIETYGEFIVPFKKRLFDQEKPKAPDTAPNAPQAPASRDDTSKHGI